MCFSKNEQVKKMFNYIGNDFEDSGPDSNMGIFLNPEPNPMYVRVCVSPTMVVHVAV